MEIYLQGKYFSARPAELSDVAVIAANLRAGDKRELERMYDDSPEKVMQDSFERSCPNAWVAVAPDGEPVAMWGVAASPETPGFGVVWLLGTDRIDECRKDFLRFSKFFDGVMCRDFYFVGNLVDIEYTGALRWLEWLGYGAHHIFTNGKGFKFAGMMKQGGA